MVLHNDTVKSLADYLCITPQSVYSKMNESKTSSGKKAEFGQGEIRRISEKYKLTANQIKEIFLPM